MVTEHAEQTDTRIQLGRHGCPQNVRNRGFPPKQPHQETPRNFKPNKRIPNPIGVSAHPANSDQHGLNSTTEDPADSEQVKLEALLSRVRRR